MGQEQSFVAHGVTQSRRHNDGYDSPVQYRNKSAADNEHKRLKARRSADSFKSDNSNGSSGYRSGSSAGEFRSDRSSSDYYCISLYKNDHYREVNKELYKPVKIPKEKRYKLQLLEAKGEDIKSARLKGYHSESDKSKLKQVPAPKKAGIRNYTPKILSENEKESWI
ncbi:uncharacterized protein [Battus philenor]|uniref:uncharacterized protein n=1 Tax=Battus philenor TaxID=42288 RepID=UPI0035D0D1D4